MRTCAVQAARCKARAETSHISEKRGPRTTLCCPPSHVLVAGLLPQRQREEAPPLTILRPAAPTDPSSPPGGTTPQPKAGRGSLTSLPASRAHHLTPHAGPAPPTSEAHAVSGTEGLSRPQNIPPRLDPREGSPHSPGNCDKSVGKTFNLPPARATGCLDPPVALCLPSPSSSRKNAAQGDRCWEESGPVGLDGVTRPCPAPQHRKAPFFCPSPISTLSSATNPVLR